MRPIAVALLLLASALMPGAAHAANDWVNMATVSMTNATTPKLANGYGCYTDGKDILCDSATSAVNFGTGGLINYGGMTVAGSVSASGVSATYISGTVIQVNASSMPCGTGINGAIRYSNISNTLEVCTGTSWSSLSSNTAPGNVSGNGSATAVAFWNGPNSLSYDAKLYWNNTGKRLGIGTTTPSATLYVAGAAGAAGGIVLGEAGGDDRFSIYQYGSLSAMMQVNKFGGLFIADNAGTPFAAFHSNGKGFTVGSGFVNTSTPNGLLVEGKVGVGTTSPTATMQVSGTFTVSTSGQATTPTFIVLSTSRVGVGTNAPGSSLTVVGEAQVGNSGAACVTATNGGAIRYSGGSLYYCNAADTWTALANGGAGNPGGATTNVQYNNNGMLGGDAGFTYVSNTGSVSASGAYYSGDSNAYFYNNRTTPALVFDANDYLRFTRASNLYEFMVGGVPVVSITGAGNLLVSGIASASTFYAGNGLVGAPSYSFANDVNSGLYRPASNIIGISIGSAEVARITTSGISTTGLMNALSVSATNISATLISASTVSSTYGYFRYISGTNIYGTFTGDGSGLTGVIAGATDRIVSGTNNATSMIAISNTGFISITQGAGATNTGWFDPTTGYVGLGVSTTGVISGTGGYFNGKVGIGTTSQDKAYAVEVFNTQTDPTAAITGLAVHQYVSVTTNGNNGARGAVFLGAGEVASGVTSSGSMRGVTIYSSRNFKGLDDSGQMAAVSGLDMFYGHYGTNATATPQTAVAYGLQLNPWIRKGTIGSLYDIYIESPLAGGTVTDGHWGLYQVDKTALNYFGGKLGVGIVTPTATLQVSGTFLVSTSAQTTPSFYVGANGNVGIGTNNPAMSLHIKGNYAGILLNETYAGADNEAFLVNYNNVFAIQNRRDDGTFLSVPYSFDMRAPAYTLFSTASGSVGIGNGSVGSSLTVVGEAQVGNSGAACVSSTNGGAIRYSAGTLYYCNGANTWAALGTGGGTVTGAGSATAVAFWNGPNSLTYESATTSGLYWNHGSSRLGVGMSNPAATLDVSQSDITGTSLNIANNNGAEITFTGAGANANIVNSGNGSQFYINSTNGPLFLGTGGAGSQLMQLRGSNVGIGVSPTATLQVSGTFTVSTTATTESPSLFIGSNGGVSIGSTTNAWVTSGSSLYVSRFGGRWGMVIAGDKNFQSDMLLVTGGNLVDQRAIQFVNSANGFDIRLVTDAGAAGRSFFHSDLATGSVGISNTTPIAKLDVIGTISASDAIQVGQSTLSCINQISGSIRFNTTSNTLQVCTNAGWVSLASGTTGGGGGSLTGGGSATAIAFWNGANSLTYENSATSGLYWDQTNSRLGVGTNTPAYTLDVSGTGMRVGRFMTSTAEPFIQFYDANGLVGLSQIRGLAGGGMRLTDSSASYNYIYISNTGLVGLGTNYPSSTLHLANSSAAIRVNANGGGSGLYGYNDYTGNMIFAMTRQTITGTSADLLLSANTGIAFQPSASTGTNPSAAVMYLTQAGKLGLGTVTPTATLQVSGTFVVSTTGQNSLASASLAVDSRGISVSTILHMGGSAISPIGAGGNAILSGTTAVSTSSAGSITMYTGGKQVMGVDYRGRVGIGSSAPATDLDVSGTSGSVWIRQGAGGALDASAGAGLKLEFGSANANIQAYDYVAGTGRNLTLNNNGGNVGIGTVPSLPFDVATNVSGMAARLLNTATSTAGGLAIRLDNATSGNYYLGFYKGGSVVGNVAYNGTGVTYNTTSDRRTKENITDTREGLQKLMQLPVRDFAFRADPSHTVVTGFIAQELEKVFPEAVTTNGDNGETPLKDASKPWSVDYGRVTPIIVKGVQDLKAESDARFSQLKAANDDLQTSLAKANESIQTLGTELDALRQEMRKLKQQAK